MIINATSVGRELTGIGKYGLSLSLHFLRNWDHPFELYVNHHALIHFRSAGHKDKIRLVDKHSSPDFGWVGHARRLLWTNQLCLRNQKRFVFNMSQTEGSICHKRQIVTVHDLIPLLFPKYHKRQYCYLRFAYRSILKNAVKVITVSQNTKDLLIDRYNIPDERISVIHNGISAAYSNCEPDSHKQDYVLYVGRFAPTKNIEGLIKAFEMLITEYKIDLELKLVGVRVKSNLNVGKEARRRITCIDNISAEDRLIDLYKSASLLVLPSFHEGFGITPVEAMACGCPTVVSNLASLPEVCGDAAYYIDPYDAESMAEGMYKVATDEQLRATLISKGLSRARMFSWEKSAQQHISVFEEVMDL